MTAEDARRPDLPDILRRVRGAGGSADAAVLGGELSRLLAEAATPEGRGDEALRRAAWELLDLLAGGALDAAANSSLDLGAFGALGDALAADAARGVPDAAADTRLWLDAIRRPALLRRIAGAGETGAWMERILRLIDAGGFGVGRLLEQRAERYGPRTVFTTMGGGRERQHTWLEVESRIEHLGRGLLALREEIGPGPLALLSENRYESALLDLACLAAGVEIVLIPAGSTDEDAAYVLGLTGAAALVVSGAAQLAKLAPHRASLPGLRAVFTLDPVPDGGPAAAPVAELARRGRAVSRDRWLAARDAVDLRAPATVMFTSGTTGRPKGIRFSQRGIVAKRFARALALPEIGDHDVLLAYLPLYHTFGRFLELMGTVFWGAQYVFLEDPSLETLREGMTRVRPTVFISVPKKWIELWEEIGRRVDVERADDPEIRRAVVEVTGDRLRWGLSAAGHLDPAVFRFFRRHGVELLSGFGMTEATGGITMTPPGAYRDGTLGLPLPGIETALDAEGELRIRGPYVMLGYVDAGEGTGLDAEGWFRTGDLMERDESGYFRLVDRKKDLYKNIKGESIAPQRVESLFRDFEAVKRAFLVGDHRPYNTLLLVPDPAWPGGGGVPDERERRETFRSIVVSVNRFLAPFERIVDFAVLDRDFEEARGELTPKGTVRRKEILAAFAPEIEALYRRVQFRDPDLGVELHVPNWIFQLLGLTANDVTLSGGRLGLGPGGGTLAVERIGTRPDGVELRVGSSRYLVRARILDVGLLLTCPALWIGNAGIARLAGIPYPARTRRLRAPREIALLGRALPFVPDEADEDALRRAEGRVAPALDDVDAAARVLAAADEDLAFRALAVLRAALRGDEGLVRDSALLGLRLAAEAPLVPVRRAAFTAIYPVEVDAQAPATLDRFLGGGGDLLDAGTVARLCDEDLAPAKLDLLVRFARGAAGGAGSPDAPGRAVVRLLAEYGAAHPGRFDLLRSAVAGIEAFARDDGVRAAARDAGRRLTEGFREWLGPPLRIAVDPDEGREYRWDDVLTFEEEIDPGDRERMRKAFSTTSMLREAIFLITGEALVRLTDIQVGGVYVSRLEEGDRRANLRVTVHTRLQGAYDFVLVIHRGLPREEIQEEILRLLVSGPAPTRAPLCQKFGAWWETHGMWTEEFLAGETLDRVMLRLTRRGEDDPVDRLRLFWPFFLWSAASGYLEYWQRNDRRLVLARPSPVDVVVPTHDYQSGTRIVAAGGREPAPDAGALLDALWAGLAAPVEEKHPDLRGLARPDLLAGALVEVAGVADGLEILRAAKERRGPAGAAIDPFLRDVEAEGYVPQRLRWAVERYRRWETLVPDATPQARAETVQEIFETYRLSELMRSHPESRVRFFRDTVLRSAPSEVSAGLGGILEEIRAGRLEGDGLFDRLLALRHHMVPGSAEEYFLARLTYPHLRPEDTAGFLSSELGGGRQTDIVVSLEDHEGRSYRVRHPVSPREVARLHRLFTEARLDVEFRPEHRYLVALNERDSIIGGIFYDVDEENRTAHLEKIAVGDRYRKQGVSDGLMNELFNRLRNAGIETITTGFFRPSYFYRFGFSVGKRQAGLVKAL